MVPGRCLCGSAVLAAMATLAPSRAARRAIARPMPRLAPVTNKVLPARLMASSSGALSGRAVPIDPGRIAFTHRVAPSQQTVEVGQALAGGHAQHLVVDLALEQHVEHVDRPLLLGDQLLQPP